MREQKGFALLEMSLAAVLATLLAVWGASAISNAMKDAAARSAAVWMLEVRDAAQQYLLRHGPALRSAGGTQGVVLAGYADWSAPTLQELRADALLSPRLPMQAQAGGGAVIRVLRTGACPGESCRLEALVHSNEPLLQGRRGGVDERQVAQWLLSAAGQGGWVSERAPGVLSGRLFSLRNPAWAGQALPPGTVAMMAGDGAQTAYLRVGDRRDPHFEGPVTALSDIHAQGNVSVGGHLLLQAHARQGDACSTEGALALERGQGLLLCMGRIWQAQQARHEQGLAVGYTVNTLYGCMTPGGTAQGGAARSRDTGHCTCPQGSRAVQVTESPPTLLQQGSTRSYICVR